MSLHEDELNERIGARLRPVIASELARLRIRDTTPAKGAETDANLLKEVTDLCLHWRLADTSFRYTLDELSQTLRESIHRVTGSDVYAVKDAEMDAKYGPVKR